MFCFTMIVKTQITYIFEIMFLQIIVNNVLNNEKTNKQT